MSRYRCFITATPGTVIWSYVDGTRRTTPTAKKGMKEKRKKRVVLASAGRAVVNRSKKCVGRISRLKCDRVNVTMTDDITRHHCCAPTTLRCWTKAIMLAIAIAYSDRRYEIIQFHNQADTIQVSKRDSSLQSGRYGTIAWNHRQGASNAQPTPKDCHN